MNNATRAQSIQTLKLLDDQGLDLKETDKFHLYLPALAFGVKNGTLPSLDTFRTVCGGRADPKSLQPKWEERDNVIYFTLPATDGTDGEGFVKRLELQNFRLSDESKGVLRSEDFKPTTGVVYHVAVLIPSPTKTF